MPKSKKEDELNNEETVEQENPPKVTVEQEKPRKEKKVKKEKSGREQDLEKQLVEKNEQLLRLAAEYDNFRKRSQREKDDIFKSSKSDVVSAILPVIDNFERASADKTESLAEYKKGIELIYSLLMESIKKLGIEAFAETGDAFDPNIHNAVMHIEDEKLDENVVALVLSKGYKIGDKVIRSATVSVAN